MSRGTRLIKELEKTEKEGRRLHGRMMEKSEAHDAIQSLVRELEPGAYAKHCEQHGFMPSYTFAEALEFEEEVEEVGEATKEEQAA